MVVAMMMMMSLMMICCSGFVHSNTALIDKNHLAWNKNIKSAMLLEQSSDLLPDNALKGTGPKPHPASLEEEKEWIGEDIYAWVKKKVQNRPCPDHEQYKCCVDVDWTELKNLRKVDQCQEGRRCKICITKTGDEQIFSMRTNIQRKFARKFTSYELGVSQSFLDNMKSKLKSVGQKVQQYTMYVAKQMQDGFEGNAIGKLWAGFKIASGIGGFTVMVLTTAGLAASPIGGAIAIGMASMALVQAGVKTFKDMMWADGACNAGAVLLRSVMVNGVSTLLHFPLDDVKDFAEVLIGANEASKNVLQTLALSEGIRPQVAAWTKAVWNSTLVSDEVRSLAAQAAALKTAVKNKVRSLLPPVVTETADKMAVWSQDIIAQCNEYGQLDLPDDPYTGKPITDNSPRADEIAAQHLNFAMQQIDFFKIHKRLATPRELAEEVAEEGDSIEALEALVESLLEEEEEAIKKCTAEDNCETLMDEMAASNDLLHTAHGAAMAGTLEEVEDGFALISQGTEE